MYLGLKCSPFDDEPEKECHSGNVEIPLRTKFSIRRAHRASHSHSLERLLRCFSYVSCSGWCLVTNYLTNRILKEHTN